MHYVWVAGHAGHELNERCDALAVSASFREELLEDEGFFEGGNIPENLFP